MRLGVHVRGTATFDGSSPPAAGWGVSLNGPDFGGSGTTERSGPGAFSVAGVRPGLYEILVHPPRGWMVKSATLAGRDLLGLPLEVGTADVNDVVIGLTLRPTTLSGIVRDANGNPSRDAHIVVFPTDQAQWTRVRMDFDFAPRIRDLRVADSGGKYMVTDLPPGEYFVAAVEDRDMDAWPAPPFLQTLTPTAIRVRIADGAPVIQDLLVKDR
jgi:hypothetical protein